jgi:hypothetical protein
LCRRFFLRPPRLGTEILRVKGRVE